MKPRRAILLLAAFALASLPLAGPGRAEETPNIAAAATLQFALTDVATAFTGKTGKEVKLAFGSSGNFFRQIQQGAPFQMFLSADEGFVMGLTEKGLTANGEGDIYAVGRLVIMAGEGSPLLADGTLADLGAALEDGRLKKFAIANPEHAPYGRAAKEALDKAGLWDAIEDKLVIGENISQAAQFATSGNAQGGLIAYSLALAPEVGTRGTYALVPEDRHRPLRQRMALLKGAGETAHAFYGFMQGEEARAIMRRYGYVLPGEAM
ncbi:molybdenum ABC transporter, periplasmic molybdate-binding protein [Parvibaculum lavamentivorans DS-1]|uniref:Molybdenum ABC transporter, periplasmic molybdate-binding protein n=1 Tax=Parvibaculum lavamentivorans (strain DS-1 / DSM 13023 / NCIMB 13966) TaxID=402881 RepID=A7HRC7_PARL1|nr:molybdate ABC transporter substrate-binding protein [Parvibaculum lavamentivorans]ABS62460.1 molybdenum ABC transporter, periplasmic molybdate-binding protein [Parvibaculum lavamentivorans DS-1]